MPPDLSALSAEAQRQLRNWQFTMWELDSRYDDKALLVLAAIAMADPEYRARLIADPYSVMSELGITTELGENTTLRFVENTADSLTVILPPSADQQETRPAELEEYLDSRLTKVAASGDDYDFLFVIKGDQVDHPPGDSRDAYSGWGDRGGRD